MLEQDRPAPQHSQATSLWSAVCRQMGVALLVSAIVLGTLQAIDPDLWRSRSADGLQIAAYMAAGLAVLVFLARIFAHSLLPLVMFSAEHQLTAMREAMVELERALEETRTSD